ncbi:digestive cysteine proteinase 1-like [Contarinia nasturtii]|uniref:digestive cysteine proteinase 1-like n=1 Tax=Contarinia nasturtii TaxID=265458 RepID=UPI0012D406AF|nr:digestive cysteine proteinase 1-like [Contarinia nasturtii]
MKNIFVIFGLLAVSNAVLEENSLHNDAWIEYKSEFGKQYDNETEEIRRFGIFLENKKYIEEHNKLYEMGNVSYDLGMNDFADLTDEEYWALSNPIPLNPSKILPGEEANRRSRRAAHDKIPDSFDWRTKKKVTVVKDQKGCTVCWAFATAGVIESHYAIKMGKLISLSEQNLVDCVAGGTKTNKCRPNNFYYPLQYVQQNGIMKESDYPYKPKGGDCKFKKNKSALKIKDFRQVTLGQEKDIRKFIATRGPLAVAISSQPKSFKLYKNGIYSNTECNNYETDHAVLIVGYGI